MLLLLKRTKIGLIPISDESAKAVSKIKLDDEIYMEWKPRRNMKFHKKYFALLNAVIINQEHYKTVDNLHESIKYRAGYYETLFMLNGDKVIKTKSIAFNKMDESEYLVFYESALDVCIELISEEAVNEILKFL